MIPDPLARLKRFIDDPGPRIGRYEVVREVARGGMAVVYEAFDPDLKRPVALKVLKDPALAERLRREAAAAAKLRHPNIVTVHEVGPDFIAMDYVAGKTLAEAMGTMKAGERFRVLETVARAIGHAHAEGVVHRDLTPRNVLLGADGRVVVTDFGLAKIAGGEDLTRTGTVVGTPHYMAPEQVRGEVSAMGPATDVWALGVMLYEAMADRRPFEGGTALEIYDGIVRSDPAPLPGDVGAIAAKALEKDPARRYPSAAALADDLNRHLAGEPTSVRPVHPLARHVRRRVIVYALVASALVALAGALLAGRALERRKALEAVRAQARVSLKAALDLRRQGANSKMREYLEPLEAAYRQAPGEPEVEHLMGRMYRALMEDRKALEHQERALAMEPKYRGARYERAVLLFADYGRELRNFYDGGPVSPQEAERLNRGLADRRRIIESDCGQAWNPAEPESEGLQKPLRLATMGMLEYCRGMYDGARGAAEEALKEDPLLEEAWEVLARVAEAELAQGVKDRDGKWRETEGTYAKAIEKDQGYVPHWIGRADVRQARGDYGKDRGRDPTGDYQGAIDDLTRAIDLDPKSAPACFRRGRVRTQMAVWRIKQDIDPDADLTLAIDDLTKALEIDPKLAAAWTWRGNAAFHRGAWWLPREGTDPLLPFEASEADFAKALEINPRDADALMRRGRLRVHVALARRAKRLDPEKDFEAAERDFADSISINPKNAWAWTWRGSGALQREEFDAAESHFTRAVEVAKEHAEAWELRGRARFERAALLEKHDRARARADYAAAAADWLEAVTLNPSIEKAYAGRIRESRKKAAELGD